MAYLVNESFLDDLVFYHCKRRFSFVKEEISENENERMTLKRKMPLKDISDSLDDCKCEREVEVEFDISHSVIWLKEKSWFSKGDMKFVPALIVRVKFEDTKLEFSDRILLNDNIGFGTDTRDLLFGGSKGRYSVVYNNLNLVLDKLSGREDRLVNFTLEDKISDIALRGCLSEALKLREKIGNFDFEKVE